MKTERVVISFIAVVIGIFVAAIAFYIYQTTKIIPLSKTKTVSVLQPTPTPATSIFLAIESPKDEDVTDKKTITISGKTTPNAIIIISTDAADDIITPAKDGAFSTTETIGDGSNQLEITAIGPDGQEASEKRTITFSTESF